MHEYFQFPISIFFYFLLRINMKSRGRNCYFDVIRKIGTVGSSYQMAKQKKLNQFLFSIILFWRTKLSVLQTNKNWTRNKAVTVVLEHFHSNENLTRWTNCAQRNSTLMPTENDLIIWSEDRTGRERNEKAEERENNKFPIA